MGEKREVAVAGAVRYPPPSEYVCVRSSLPLPPRLLSLYSVGVPISPSPFPHIPTDIPPPTSYLCPIFLLSSFSFFENTFGECLSMVLPSVSQGTIGRLETSPSPAAPLHYIPLSHSPQPGPSSFTLRQSQKEKRGGKEEIGEAPPLPPLFSPLPPLIISPNIRRLNYCSSMFSLRSSLPIKRGGINMEEGVERGSQVSAAAVPSFTSFPPLPPFTSSFLRNRYCLPLPPFPFRPTPSLPPQPPFHPPSLWLACLARQPKGGREGVSEAATQPCLRRRGRN